MHFPALFVPARFVGWRERARAVLVEVTFAAISPARRLFYRWDDRSLDYVELAAWPTPSVD